ncbi:MAG: small multi-drug export protein [Candidatus Latescibacterota bacterium]|nr:MAG: small multi-drug export protein [Candidatus Latescibacterota bacterium]
MLPIVELRGAIPWALTIGALEWPRAYLFSVIGNMVPVVPLLLFLEPVSKLLRRFRFMDRFFNWLFARTRKREWAIRRYGPIGLVLFVAIPLPITGAWTGCAAAFVFGIPFHRSFFYILLGVCIAGAIVTAAVLGGVSLGGLLFSR